MSLYADIKHAHQIQIEYLKARGKIADNQELSISTLNKNNRTIAVMMSPDTKFSGSINNQIFRDFATFAEQNPQAEIVIVGAIGQQHFTTKFPDRQFEGYSLPDRLSQFEDLRPLMNKLIKYSRVEIFFGQFLNLVKQQPRQQNISGSQSNATKTGVLTDKRDFTFEPELKVMLRFFEIQIFSVLLLTSHHESYLATLGSRITTLETAAEAVSDQRKQLKHQRLMLYKKQKARKQRQRLAGAALW